jgi:hypothetical protein
VNGELKNPPEDACVGAEKMPAEAGCPKVTADDEEAGAPKVMVEDDEAAAEKVKPVVEAGCEKVKPDPLLSAPSDFPVKRAAAASWPFFLSSPCALALSS